MYTVHREHSYLGKRARKELDWWLTFCAAFNGKRKIEYEEYPITLISDSFLEGLPYIRGKNGQHGRGRTK